MSASRRTMLVLAMLSAVLAAAFWGAYRTASLPPVRLGAVLPLSGPARYVGEEVRDGLLMAAGEINARGGIGGRSVDIRIEDGRTDPAAAREAFLRLAGEEPLLVMTALSAVAAPLAPLAEERRVLMAGLVATDPELTAGRSWVYRYWPTAEQEAAAISALLLSERPRRLCVIYLDDGYGRSVFKAASRFIEAEGGKADGIPFPLGEQGYDRLARHCLDADAVCIVGYDFHIIAILKALRAAGYAGTLLSTTTASLPSVRSVPEAEGLHVVAPAIYNRNYIFADAVKREYEQRYNKPFTQYSANGYDFLHPLAGLVESGEPGVERLKRLFEDGFVYSGLFGNIELRPGTQDIVFPLLPARISGGELNYR